MTADLTQMPSSESGPVPRLLIARWAPSHATKKAVLAEACEQTGVRPRPTWLFPSHRELLAEIEPVARDCNVSILAQTGRGHSEGGRDEYQSVAIWAIRHPQGKPTSMSWDARTGKFRSDLRDSSYASFRKALPPALERARVSAEVNRVDIRDQLTLALMDSFAIAPFCSLSHIGRGLWMLAAEGDEFRRGRRFLQLAGCRASSLSELSGPREGTVRVVEKSLLEAERRFSNRTGWIAIARTSHEALLRSVGR